MDRRATPPRRDTSPIWSPPPPCKQALKCYDLCEAKLHYLRCAPNSLLCQTMFTLKIAAALKSYFLWVCRGWQAALARDFCSPYFLWYFTFRKLVEAYTFSCFIFICILRFNHKTVHHSSTIRNS